MSDLTIHNVSRELHHFAVIPVSVLRDAALSDAAVRLYASLDGRITEADSARIRQDTLAADLGWSRSKLQRALAELAAAELVESKRTSRSSRLAVRNPVRRAVDNPSSDAPDLTQQAERCVRSDAADASDLTPPQINISLISNQQQSGETATATPPPLALAEDPGTTETDSKIRDYLEAITAASGAELTATKTVQKLLGKVKGRGITPRDLGALVAAYLAVHRANVDNVPGWIAGHVLPAVAAGELTEPPAGARPTPTPPTAAELADAERCNHGEIEGRCPLCRRALQPLRELLAAELPDAVIVSEVAIKEKQGRAEAWIDFAVPGLPGLMISLTYDGTRFIQLDVSPHYAGDEETPVSSISYWRWMDLAADKAAAGYGVRATPETSLTLEKIHNGITVDDLHWFLSTVPAAVYRRFGVRDDIPHLAPLGSEISWEGSVATVSQDGRTIAHISVDLEADAISSASWFLDIDGASETRVRNAASDGKRCLSGKPWRGITTETTADTLAVHMDPLTGGRSGIVGVLSGSDLVSGFHVQRRLQTDISRQAAAPKPNPVLEEDRRRALTKLGAGLPPQPKPISSLEAALVRLTQGRPA